MGVGLGLQASRENQTRSSSLGTCWARQGFIERPSVETVLHPPIDDNIVDQALVGRTLGLAQTQGARCAMVGSSGRLLDRQYGPEIDKADVVMRFNYAPVTGYEGIVGSRTTILAVGKVAANRKKMIGRALDLNATMMVMNHPRRFGPYRHRESHLGSGRFGLAAINPKFANDARRELSHLGGCTTSKPSLNTGMWGLALLMRYCAEVDVYGITLPGMPVVVNNKYHYYDGDEPFHYQQEDYPRCRDQILAGLESKVDCVHVHE